MVLLMSEKQVKAHWEAIQKDPYYPYPGHTMTAQQFINLCKREEVKFGNYEVVISNTVWRPNNEHIC